MEPLTELPTYTELCCILEDEFGCVLTEDVLYLHEVDASYAVHYFERDLGGRLEQCPIVLPEDMDGRVSLSLLRHIIARLEVDPGMFGLDPSSFD